MVWRGRRARGAGVVETGAAVVCDRGGVGRDRDCRHQRASLRIAARFRLRHDRRVPAVVRAAQHQRYGWWLISAETPFALGGLRGAWRSPSRVSGATQRFARRALAAWRRSPLVILDLVRVVRAVGRVVVSPVPAAGLAGDDARRRVARRPPPTARRCARLRGAAMVALAAIGVSGVSQAVRRDAFAVGARRGEVRRGRENRRVADRTGRRRSLPRSTAAASATTPAG